MEKDLILKEIREHMGDLSQMIWDGYEIEEYDQYEEKIEGASSVEELSSLRAEIKDTLESYIDAINHDENQRYLEWEYWRSV